MNPKPPYNTPNPASLIPQNPKHPNPLKAPNLNKRKPVCISGNCFAEASGRTITSCRRRTAGPRTAGRGPQPAERGTQFAGAAVQQILLLCFTQRVMLQAGQRWLDSPESHRPPPDSRPKGPWTQVMGFRAQVPSYGIRALQPYYLGPWTLRDSFKCSLPLSTTGAQMQGSFGSCPRPKDPKYFCNT